MKRSHPVRVRSRAPRVAFLAAMAIVTLSAPSSAWAERGEWSSGLSSGLLLPGFESQDQASFRLATWFVSAQARYGLFDQLDLRIDVSWARFSGEAEERLALGRDVVARRVFRAQQFGVRIGARYKWLSGYVVAPYLEADVGYQWSVFSAQDIRDVRSGQSFGIDVPDEGQGGLTVSVGAAVDLRVFNLFFVGLAVRVTEIFGGGRYTGYVTVPLELSVYW